MNARSVVLVASSDHVVSETIAVPPPEASVSRDQIIRNELSRAHRLPTGGFEFASCDLPPGISGPRVAQAHAVALPHAAVQPILEGLDGTGLEILSTVSASQAMLCAAQRFPIDPRRISAVLDIGSDRAYLATMYSGRVVHERKLPDYSLAAIRRELAAHLDVNESAAGYAMGYFGFRDEPIGEAASATSLQIASALEGLIEEISMSFAFVSHIYTEAELGPLLLTGGGANLTGLASMISRAIDLSTHVISPATLLQSDCFGTESSDPALTIAVGAALVARGAS